MSNKKCRSCGLFNWPSDAVCERCGAPLVEGDANARAAEPEEYSHEQGERAPKSEEHAPERRERAPEPSRPDFPMLTLGGDAAAGSRTWKIVLAAVLAAVLCGAGLVVYKIRVDLQRPGSALSSMRKRLVGPSIAERTRDTLRSYLAQPGIVGTGLSEQVLGPVSLEILQMSDREVYFSAPAPAQSGETFDAMVSRVVTDPKRIVEARDDLSGYMRLGDYSLRRSTEKSFFFKTPIDNVKFDPATVLKFPFEQATYTLDRGELNDFIQNRSIF